MKTQSIKSWTWGLLVAVCLVPAWVLADDAPVNAHADPGKCMMWKVSSDTATVYLVGSMHMSTPEMYPLPKEMEDAFSKSDVLVVEVNINKVDQQKLAGLVMQRGVYGPDKTLSTSVSKETSQLLKDVCGKIGLPLIAIDQTKPWVAGMMIEVMAVQQSGLDPKLGIDKHFLDQADEKNKKVEELESADFQINLMAGFDAALQEKALVATLEEVKDMKSEMSKLTHVWVAGDVKGLSDMMAEKDKKHPELEVIEKKMIEDRNVPMEEKVENYLKGKQTVFVVAGLAHMVGDKGIVKLLQDHKFTVEQSTATRSPKHETKTE